MKIGDKLKFKKFDWVIVDKKEHISGHIEFRYRVYRKYLNFGKKYIIPLSNTKCNYSIGKWRWDFLKKKLKQNSDYHYNMSLWSNCPR